METPFSELPVGLAARTMPFGGMPVGAGFGIFMPEELGATALLPAGEPAFADALLGLGIPTTRAAVPFARVAAPGLAALPLGGLGVPVGLRAAPSGAFGLPTGVFGVPTGVFGVPTGAVSVPLGTLGLTFTGAPFVDVSLF